MEGDREDARVAIEDGLHAIPVMAVDVHVEDAADPELEQVMDADRDVVEDAEPGRAARHRMVESPAKIVGTRGAPLRDEVAREHRGAGLEQRGVVHPRERRVVSGGEAEVRLRNAGLCAEALHDVDIRALVHRQHVAFRRRRRLAFLRPAEEAERLDEIARELHALFAQRVVRAKVVLQEIRMVEEKRTISWRR